MTTDPQTAEEIPLETAATVAHRRRGLLFIGLAVGCLGFAFALQLGMNSNFVGDEMKLTGDQQGNLEAVRESCGIFAFGILALLAGFAEPLVAAAMLLMVGAGLGAYWLVPDYGWLIVASLVWSQGLHVWMPLPNTMTLALAEPGRTGYRLGQMRAAGMMGAGVGLLAGLVLSRLGTTIRPLFLLAGGAAVLAAAACLAIPRRIRTPGPRLVLRRKYWLYYLLSFLEGWRKQIFVAFAGFLLVKHYHVKLEVMLLLAMAHHAIGWAASPFVGRLIDRVGERPVLVFYFAGLTCFFTGYALVKDVYVLGGLYVMDSAFFVFAIAMTTYVSRIAPKQEYRSTLSMGVAFDHVAAVLMPLLGAVLWREVGYEWVFLIGAAAAALSVPAAMLLPGRGGHVSQDVAR
ncbi:MAG TPA: MFS transporter [Phycisphaerae bacterium]|nr:MFS transporter [Phycisphaerae bacterium]